MEETYVLFSYAWHKHLAIYQEGSQASGHGKNGDMDEKGQTNHGDECKSHEHFVLCSLPWGVQPSLNM